MKYCYDDIQLKKIPSPKKDCSLVPVLLTDKTIEDRKKAIINRMKNDGLNVLIIYGDLEHGSNFEYLVGFLPRFEEALLVLHDDEKAYLILGNENFNKANKSRIPIEPILSPYFSLPNQPMSNKESFCDILKKTNITDKKIGIVGWKLFTSKCEDNNQLYDIPYFILDSLFKLCGKNNVKNSTDIFIGENGVRNTNNANEIAHYEFGSSLSSDCMLDAMNSLKVGISEMEVADRIERYGQRKSVVTIVAFGARFIKANMYPTDKKLELGESISMTIGHKGGLSSRSGYGVHNANELLEGTEEYIKDLVAPYYTAIRAWLENIRVGMSGGELYDLIESVLPKNEYNWSLCPGHLTADEEWSCSPIYKDSNQLLKSGMILQTDIIPSLNGYSGVCAESTVCLADMNLKRKIKKEYPEMYKRMLERKKYIVDILGIKLHDDVLPTASTLAYMRPFMLSNEAVIIKK